MLFQRADRFHKRPFKTGAYAHNFPRSLHLRCQRSFGRNKFIERQPGDFYHAIVQRWFKACICLARNSVFNLIQSISQSDLRRHFRDGISCRLAGQRGRTAHPGINLYDAIFKAFRVQGELHITSPRDLQLVNNIQCGAS